MIDNFDLIKSLLSFNNGDEFYFLQIIQRKKDIKDSDLDVKYAGKNNHSRLIRAYYIYSVDQLEKYKEEIIAMCNLFKARACINLNKRNQKDTALEMLELLARDIRVGNYSCVSKIYNSVCGSVHSADKTFLVDIDTNDQDFIYKIESTIKQIVPVSDKVIAKIPSKSGVHLITKPFNRMEFSKHFPEVEIHKNNPTNLYIPE